MKKEAAVGTRRRGRLAILLMMISVVCIVATCVSSCTAQDAGAVSTAATVVSGITFRPFLRFPNHRGIIYAGQPKQVVLGFEVAGNTTYPIGNMAITATVKNASGAPVSESTMDTLVAKTWQNMGITVDSLVPGNYTVAVILKDKPSGTQLGSDTLSFTIADSTKPMPRVYIDEYNRCILDGEPYFPLGFYTDSRVEHDADLDRMAASKLNVLLSYETGGYSVAEATDFLNRCDARGLKVMFNVHNCYDGITYSRTSLGAWTGPYNVLQGLVGTFKNHHGLFAWYIGEELPDSILPQVQRNYEYIKSADQNHPTYYVTWSGTNLKAFAPLTDVFGLDSYPVLWGGTGTPKMERFGQDTVAARTATMASRGLWMVPECSSQRSYQSTSQTPTYTQIMNECYQGLVNGSRGFIFYTLYHLMTENGLAQWNVMTQVGNHLDSIKSVALGIDAPPVMSVTPSDTRVSALTRQVGNDLYVLAVNPYQVSVPCTFRLGMGSTATRIDVGPPGTVQRSITVSSGSFSDTIEALGTRVYKLVTQ